MGNTMETCYGGDLHVGDIATRYGPVWWYDGYMTNKT